MIAVNWGVNAPANGAAINGAVGVKIVFALHNFAYTDAGLFQDVDAVMVPSRTAQEHYRRVLPAQRHPFKNVTN